MAVKAGEAYIEVRIDRSKFDREFRALQNQIRQQSVGVTGGAGGRGSGRGGISETAIGAGIGAGLASQKGTISSVVKVSKDRIQELRKEIKGLARGIRNAERKIRKGASVESVYGKWRGFAQNMKAFNTEKLKKMRQEFNAIRFNQASEGLKEFGNQIPILGRLTALLNPATAAFTVITASITASVFALKQFAAQQNEISRLNKFIKATGGTAGFTAKELDKLSRKMAYGTVFDDTQIKRAMGVMLTFRKVTGNTFKEAVSLSLDMSEALGTDAQQSVIQLGKALEDPIAGISAMSRSGISFAENEKKKIKELVKSNKLIEAQRMILDAVSGQVKGLATNDAKNLANQFAEVKDQAGSLTAEVGRLISEFKKIPETLSNIAKDLNKLTSWMEKLNEKMENIAKIQQIIAEKNPFEKKKLLGLYLIEKAMKKAGIEAKPFLSGLEGAKEDVEEINRQLNYMGASDLFKEIQKSALNAELSSTSPTKNLGGPWGMLIDYGAQQIAWLKEIAKRLGVTPESIGGVFQ